MPAAPSRPQLENAETPRTTNTKLVKNWVTNTKWHVCLEPAPSAVFYKLKIEASSLLWRWVEPYADNQASLEIRGLCEDRKKHRENAEWGRPQQPQSHRQIYRVILSLSVLLHGVLAPRTLALRCHQTQRSQWLPTNHGSVIRKTALRGCWLYACQ